MGAWNISTASAGVTKECFGRVDSEAAEPSLDSLVDAILALRHELFPHLSAKAG